VVFAGVSVVLLVVVVVFSVLPVVLLVVSLVVSVVVSVSAAVVVFVSVSVQPAKTANAMIVLYIISPFYNLANQAKNQERP
tara:strand:- start:6135 stop:6377 length:243 start_codon:yes stop_codon:yes gene_type:complete